jgi:hypothetical protein
MYHFRVRRELYRARAPLSLSAVIVVNCYCYCYSVGCVRNTKKETVTARRAEHSEPYPRFTK